MNWRYKVFIWTHCSYNIQCMYTLHIEYTAAHSAFKSNKNKRDKKTTTLVFGWFGSPARKRNPQLLFFRRDADI